MNPFTSAVVRNLVASGGLDENIQILRREYARRLQALGAALNKYLPAAEWVTPRGGFFWWIRMAGMDTAELRRARRKLPGWSASGVPVFQPERLAGLLPPVFQLL